MLIYLPPNSRQLRTIMKSWVPILLVIVLLAGCGTPPSVRTERSQAITATGQASIENTIKKGFHTTRLFALKIDGELVQQGKSRGVHPLSPGHHEVLVLAWFSRMGGLDLVIDAGEATLPLEAKSGVRYRVTGRKLGNEAAEVWIEDANTGQPATPVTRVKLNPNPQDIPILIPIPI